MSGRCSICQESFNPDEISALKCGHTFHFTCVSRWLRKSSSCPVCRLKCCISTDVVQHLFFDRGEDSLTGIDSPASAATRLADATSNARELSKKITQLENEVKENKRLRTALEKESKKSTDQVQELRRTNGKLEEKLKSSDQIAQQNKKLTRENNDLKRKLKLLDKIKSLVEDVTGDYGNENDAHWDAQDIEAYKLSYKILKKQIDASAKEKEVNALAIKRLERTAASKATQINELKSSVRKMKDQIAELTRARESGSKKNKCADPASTKNFAARQVEPMELDDSSDSMHGAFRFSSSLRTTGLADRWRKTTEVMSSDDSSDDDSPRFMGKTTTTLRPAGKPQVVRTKTASAASISSKVQVTQSAGRAPYLLRRAGIRSGISKSPVLSSDEETIVVISD